MSFEIKKVSEHGTTNPIVARLSLQILEILRQSNVSEEVKDKVGDLYMNSLQKKAAALLGDRREIQEGIRRRRRKVQATRVSECASRSPSDRQTRRGVPQLSL